jgi:hypothetical protein
MIRIRSARSVWTTTSGRWAGVTPMVMKRGSSVEGSGSGIVPASESPKTDAASLNETPCILRLSAAFCGSHSNSTRRAYSQPARARDPFCSAVHTVEYRGESRAM